MRKRKNNKLSIFLGIVCIILLLIIINNKIVISDKTKEIEELSSQNEMYSDNLSGMKVTILGGATLENDRNINACGYVIRTKNNKLIIVDGGRDTDKELVKSYIGTFGNGTVDYWFITHPHSDHVGALVEILNEEDSKIKIKNLCYSFNEKSWYEKYDERGWESEEKMIDSLDSNVIENKISCYKDQKIDIDNVECDILRIANPEVTQSDNGNDSSMVFKFIAKDVNLSMIFLGDAFNYTSKELMEEPEKLKSDAVQMAHHGQHGVTKEVYEAIKPKLCFFSAPNWLYNNDNGNGYNSGSWQSIEVRGWVEELGAKSIKSYDGDRTVYFTKNGIEY